MATHLPANLSPDSVDTLTELASIITRLRAQQAAAASTTTADATNITSAATTGATPVATTQSQTPLPSGTTPGASTSTSGQLLLSVKELPAATDNLKHKLQRARQAMHALGDVQRTIGQQQAEIAKLEARRGRQGEMLAGMQEGGMRFLRGQGEDGEGEGDRMVE
ncbi:hypothetical protein VTI74DRAFT_9495 [Chaetomium olivicolor]